MSISKKLLEIAGEYQLAEATHILTHGMCFYAAERRKSTLLTPHMVELHPPEENMAQILPDWDTQHLHPRWTAERGECVCVDP